MVMSQNQSEGFTQGKARRAPFPAHKELLGQMFLVQFYAAPLVYVLGHSVVHTELLLICWYIKITGRKVT